MRSSKPSLSVVSTFKKQGFSVSRLSSGLRVISVDDGSGITGVGMFTSNCPSNESKPYYGSSALLECLPMSDNQRFTATDSSKFFERTGNCFKMINVKECLGYLAMAPRYNVKDTLELLTAMALHPSKDENTFLSAKASAQQSAAIFERDAVKVCFEQIYTAGWGKHGVGVPQIPAPEVIEELTHEKFNEFTRVFARPETTVVAATGVSDHLEFANLVEKVVDFDCTEQPPYMETAVFKGGSIMKESLEAPDSVRKFAEKNLTHIAMCMPTVSVAHPDFYTYSVLQTLMGGGTSFSSGGPGKGLQTKLFQEVINKEGWIHGIECLTGWFKCGGLIGLYGQCPHEWNLHLHRTIMLHLATMSQRLTQAQLDMAKNQFMSQLVLLGEARETTLEEMGKTLLVHDHVNTSNELLQGAQKVTLADISRVSRECIEGKKMSYSVFGNIEGLPDVDATNATLQAMFKRMN
jgi:processing peptidase subunit alpha